jgi:hypothetical protein
MRHIPPTRAFPALSVLLWATAFTTAGFAQNPAPTPPPRQTYQMAVVQVKPEMGREWRDYIKNDANPAAIKAGVTRRQVWTTATFGEAGEYVLVTPIENFAQFDGPSRVVKALGQEAADALLAKRQRLINGSRSFAVTARPDLSVAPEPGYQLKLAVSARKIVAQGHMADFAKYTKELSAVIAKTNAKGVLVSQIGLGGNPSEFITLVLFDSFDEIGKFSEAFTKSSAEANLTPEPAGTVANSEWRVYRYSPELSIIPVPQKAGNQ